MAADLGWQIAVAAWIGWAAIWVLAAKGAGSAKRRDGLKAAVFYRVPFIAGGVLLFASPFISGGGLPRQLVPIGLILLVAGLAFSLWARRHLGRNWSGRVAVLNGQSLIQTGPYRFVRHPIYAGAFLALAGSAIAAGGWAALAAAPIAAIGLAVKTLREERSLMAHFGKDFAVYQQLVPALVPFVQPRFGSPGAAGALARATERGGNRTQAEPAAPAE